MEQLLAILDAVAAIDGAFYNDGPVLMCSVTLLRQLIDEAQKEIDQRLEKIGGQGLRSVA